MLFRFLPVLAALWFSQLTTTRAEDSSSENASPANANRPNVILVMTDDQGYGDLGCTGNPILKTPAIDALATESVRLTDYHVSPTCSPTRAALLTGHVSNRTGVWHTIMGRSLLRANEVTLANVFQDAGYASGLFGKWHLGDNHPYRPQDRGFDEVFWHGGGGMGQTPDHWNNAYFDATYWHRGQPTQVDGFCTDVFFERATEFIAEQKQNQKPFFAYIVTNAPHGPMQCPQEFSEPYSDLPLVLANFYGMIANIDHNMQKLIEFVDQSGLADNTILIFTTDNGSSSGWRKFNAGMRDGKGSEYDGGHRVPLFIRWPAGNLAHGQDVDQLTAHVDVMPTLIELCDLSAPVAVQFDGTSIASLLKNPAAAWTDRVLITDSQRVKTPIKWKQSAVMTARWRLINGKKLYDIKQDPGQKNDIADQHPETVQRLVDHYEQWWNDLLPTFDQPANISIGNPAENPASLTAHDWITQAPVPWNQRFIREASAGLMDPGDATAVAEGEPGLWYVDVHQPGRYEFRLRRWPAAAGAAIDAALPTGDPLPADATGEDSFRQVPGKSLNPTQATVRVGQNVASVPVDAGMEEVSLSLELESGPQELVAQFLLPDGVVLGAYYVDVEFFETSRGKSDLE